MLRHSRDLVIHHRNRVIERRKSNYMLQRWFNRGFEIPIGRLSKTAPLSACKCDWCVQPYNREKVKRETFKHIGEYSEGYT